jgi:hypothetical protein
MKKGLQPTMIESPNAGRDAEIRTRDLTHPKRARYQAAPRPVCAVLVSLQKINCQIKPRRKARAAALLSLVSLAFSFLLEKA